MTAELLQVLGFVFFSISTFQCFSVIGHIPHFVFCQQEASLPTLGVFSSKIRDSLVASVHAENMREAC